jgi:hypothetical protein
LGKGPQNEAGRDTERPPVLTVQYLIPLVHQHVDPFYDRRIKTMCPGGVEVLGKLPEAADKRRGGGLYVPVFPQNQPAEFLPGGFPAPHKNLFGHIELL